MWIYWLLNIYKSNITDFQSRWWSRECLDSPVPALKLETQLTLEQQRGYKHGLPHTAKNLHITKSAFHICRFPTASWPFNKSGWICVRRLKINWVYVDLCRSKCYCSRVNCTCRVIISVNNLRTREQILCNWGNKEKPHWDRRGRDIALSGPTALVSQARGIL